MKETALRECTPWLISMLGMGGIGKGCVKPRCPCVALNLGVLALLHNTENAYYECAATKSTCRLNIVFSYGNAAVLVSPSPKKAHNTSNEEWYIKLSYGLRWPTYILGISGMTLLLFWAYDFSNRLSIVVTSAFGHVHYILSTCSSYVALLLGVWNTSF